MDVLSAKLGRVLELSIASMPGIYYTANLVPGFNASERAYSNVFKLTNNSPLTASSSFDQLYHPPQSYKVEILGIVRTCMFMQFFFHNVP